MSTVLLQAIIFITLALIFYTTAVWSEKIQGILKPWHLIFFGLGLIFDTLGTGKMSQLAGEITLSLHSITGGAAIILMLIHFIWATFVIVKGDQEAKKSFHKFSLVVWCIWLIPYFVGMFLGMA